MLPVTLREFGTHFYWNNLRPVPLRYIAHWSADLGTPRLAVFPFSRASTRRAQDRSKSRDTCRQLPCTISRQVGVTSTGTHTYTRAACAYRQLRTPRAAMYVVTGHSALSRRQLIRRRLENT